MLVNGLSSSLSAPASQLTQARTADNAVLGTDTVSDRKDSRAQRDAHAHGRALGIFRQEMRHALKMQFHVRFAAAQPSYLQTADPASGDDVAAETLSAARHVIAESPARAGKSIAALKASVQHAATVARQSLDTDDDSAVLTDTVSRIGDDLDDLGRDTAVNRESSASILAVDTRAKQRSLIRIRTQEGDIVRFDLQQIERLLATDVAISNEAGSASSTEVTLSSRSSIAVSVKGDLNESELAAITSVLEQAEIIANDFFDGDIGAAFNLSQGFEFDAEQLAHVNLRFRMRQVTNVSYAGPSHGPAIDTAEPATVSQPPAADSSLSGGVPATEPVAQSPIGEVVARNSPLKPQPDSAPLTDTTTLASFFDLVSTFLRSTGDGFSDGGGGTPRLHFSESFKLELLRTVIHASAPAESDNAAANADMIIGSVVDVLPDAED